MTYACELTTAIFQYIRETSCDSDLKWVSVILSLRFLSLTHSCLDDEDSDQENVLINIPVPPAPRKPHPIKKSSKANTTGIVRCRNDKDMASKDPKDLFNIESPSTDTDADTSNKDSDDGNDASDGDTELDELSTNPKALKKFFVNEAYVTNFYSFYLKLMQCYLAPYLVEG